MRSHSMDDFAAEVTLALLRPLEIPHGRCIASQEDEKQKESLIVA